MFSTFLVWQYNAWGVPLILAVVLGMITGFMLGAGVEVSLIRGVAKKSEAGVFVVSIALFLGLNSLAAMIWGNLPPEQMQSLFPDEPKDFVRIFGAV